MKTKSIDIQKLEELAARVQGGETQAFGQLYDVMAKQIYRYLHFKLNNHDDAEDVMAETWRKAWLGLSNGGYRQKNFKGWLYRVAYTTMIDFVRQRKSQRYEELPEQLVADKETVQEELMRREEQEWLLRAVRQLEQPYQDIIWLRFVEELSIAETAKALERSELTIRVYQYRGLQKLKKMLGGGSSFPRRRESMAGSPSKPGSKSQTHINFNHGSRPTQG